LSADTQSPILSWRRVRRGKGMTYIGSVPAEGSRPTRKSVEAAVVAIRLHMQRHGLVRGVTYSRCERIEDDVLVVMTIHVESAPRPEPGQKAKRFNHTKFQRKLDGDDGVTHKLRLDPVVVNGEITPAAEATRVATKPLRVTKLRPRPCRRRVGGKMALAVR
jgi:hypothetical protein